MKKTVIYDILWTGKGYSGEPWSNRYTATSLKEARKAGKEVLNCAGGTIKICRVETIITEMK